VERLAQRRQAEEDAGESAEADCEQENPSSNGGVG
jgi:hypothetical protein